MLVTRVEKAGKGRYRVYLDEKENFVLYQAELSQYGIRQDGELPEEVYREILEDVLQRRARLRCMNLLKSMDRTEWQLREKLSQGGYPKEIIDQAIDYVKGYGYVDDARYASRYLECYRERKSLMRMTWDLKDKGISPEEIRLAVEAVEPVDEKALIRRWIAKKKVDLTKAESSEIRKLYMFLMRKGFSARVVSKVIKESGDFYETDTFT